MNWLIEHTHTHFEPQKAYSLEFFNLFFLQEKKMKIFQHKKIKILNFKFKKFFFVGLKSSNNF